MLTYYKLRIDTNDRTGIDNLLDCYSDRYSVVFEKQDTNCHCHCYFETTSKGPAIRAKIRKLYGSGNKVYSLKEVDKFPVEYLAYMMKEGEPYYVGFTDEEKKIISEHQEKVKEEMKLKKKSRRTQLQLLDEICLEKFTLSEHDGRPIYVISVTSSLDTHDEFVTYQHILDIVLEYTAERGTLIREFMLVSLVQTLSLKYASAYKYTLRNRLVAKLIEN